MDKDLLFRPRLPEDDVEIPGVGTVRVRGLSRQEMLDAAKGHEDDDSLGMEREMLAYAMLDPKMTVDDVARWQQVSPASEINDVLNRVNALSGIGPGAAKRAYKSVRRDRSRVRISPSEQVGDDSDADASGDAR